MGYQPKHVGTCHCRSCGIFISPSGRDYMEMKASRKSLCVSCWLPEYSNIQFSGMPKDPGDLQEEVDETLIKIYGLSNMCREWQEEF